MIIFNAINIVRFHIQRLFKQLINITLYNIVIKSLFTYAKLLLDIRISKLSLTFRNVQLYYLWAHYFEYKSHKLKLLFLFMIVNNITVKNLVDVVMT